MTGGRKNEVSSIPELVGVAEAALILERDGRSVGAMERRRAEKAEYGQTSDFPAPVQRLAMGPLWLRADIEEYKRRRHDKPGPVAGARARRPHALQGYSEEELDRALYDPEAGLSEREKEVLGPRLGLQLGLQLGLHPDQIGQVGVEATLRQALRRSPVGQQAIADELGISLSAVKKAQERAIIKVLAAVGSGSS